jgi:signal transduction histidine kinase
MIYFLFMILISVLVALYWITRRRRRQLFALLAMALSLACALCFFFVYLCKDVFHLNIFMDYFSFSRPLVLRLYALHISKESLLRLLNASCLVFLMSNTVFSSAFAQRWYGMRKFFAVLFTLELALYDPVLYKYFYIALYPRFVSSISIEAWYGGFKRVTAFLNITSLLLCFMIIFWETLRTLPMVAVFKCSGLILCLSYLLLIISYILFFSGTPSLMVKYSKAADYMTFRSLASVASLASYQYLPYALMVLFVLFFVSLIFYSSIRQRIEQRNLEITHNIKGANVSSRVFCHYLKNEILAISAEMEFIAAVVPEAAENIIKRCEGIYTKLDGIHKSMRDNSMNIRCVPADGPIRAALAALAAGGKAEGLAVQTNYPQNMPFILVDPIYFEQALNEILMNALDAMASAKEQALHISVREVLRWVSVRIADTGCGIPAGSLEDIFTPLYTSKPTSRHWGIGLSMAHRVVSAFNGRISVSSTVGKGTVFEIVLPGGHPAPSKKRGIYSGGQEGKGCL